MTERAGVAENLSPGGVSPWNFLIPFMTDFRSWACTEISWMLKHDSMAEMAHAPFNATWGRES